MAQRRAHQGPVGRSRRRALSQQPRLDGPTGAWPAVEAQGVVHIAAQPGEAVCEAARFTGLRKWANNVYHGGSRRLNRAYHRWRQQNELDRRQFETWRANRGRERPADPLNGKLEKSFGAFSFERSRYGNEEWWKEGVAKYQAPKWMLFQK